MLAHWWLGQSRREELTGPAAIRLEGLRVVLQHFQHGDMKPPAVSGLISHRAKAMPCSIAANIARGGQPCAHSQSAAISVGTKS